MRQSFECCIHALPMTSTHLDSPIKRVQCGRKTKQIIFPTGAIFNINMCETGDRWTHSIFDQFVGLVKIQQVCRILSHCDSASIDLSFGPSCGSFVVFPQADVCKLQYFRWIYLCFFSQPHVERFQYLFTLLSFVLIFFCLDFVAIATISQT